MHGLAWLVSQAHAQPAARLVYVCSCMLLAVGKLAGKMHRTLRCNDSAGHTTKHHKHVISAKWLLAHSDLHLPVYLVSRTLVHMQATAGRTDELLSWLLNCLVMTVGVKLRRQLYTL